MLEWFSDEIARASRSKRCFASGLSDRCCGRTLIATVRSSRVSRARYTSPIPPAPIAETISYGPSREPAFRDTLAEIIGRSCPYPRSDRVPSVYLRGEGVADGKATNSLLAFAPAFA